MKTITTTFPDDIALQEGEFVSIDTIAQNGAQIVTRVVRREGPKSDRRKAVEAFLRRWTGAGISSTTDEEIRAERTTRLIKKHLR